MMLLPSASGAQVLPVQVQCSAVARALFISRQPSCSSLEARSTFDKWSHGLYLSIQLSASTSKERIFPVFLLHYK
jgi:hypothetical protein